MTKRTTALILILAVFTAGLLYLALIGTAPKKVVVVPTPTPVSPNAKTSLSLEDAPASLSSKLSQHTVAVVVDSTNLVNGVQIELGYDPNTIINISVAPGPFFKEPTTLIKTINKDDGRISYALAEQLDVKGHAGQGIVALVSFDINPGATASQTTLVFMPKTAVTSQGILESVLKKTTNYTLNLTPAPVRGNPSPATSSAQ